MGLKDDIYKAFEKNLGKEYLDADADETMHGEI